MDTIPYSQPILNILYSETGKAIAGRRKRILFCEYYQMKTENPKACSRYHEKKKTH